MSEVLDRFPNPAARPFVVNGSEELQRIVAGVPLELRGDVIQGLLWRAQEMLGEHRRAVRRIARDWPAAVESPLTTALVEVCGG